MSKKEGLNHLRHAMNSALGVRQRNPSSGTRKKHKKLTVDIETIYGKFKINGHFVKRFKERVVPGETFTQEEFKNFIEGVVDRSRRVAYYSSINGGFWWHEDFPLGFDSWIIGVDWKRRILKTLFEAEKIIYRP